MKQSVLIATDIFGRCDGVARLQQDLMQHGANIDIVDPYQGKAQLFADEQQAYAAYIQHCGHDNYAALVAGELTAPVTLAIGFSAGASALWRATACKVVSGLSRIVLFYPGQLHQHMALRPGVNTDIIFGQTEHHFDVDVMINGLQQRTAVNCHKTPYQHGFMNPASAAFNEVGYQHYLGLLLQIIAEREG